MGGLLPHGFKPCASAYSATLAHGTGPIVPTTAASASDPNNGVGVCVTATQDGAPSPHVLFHIAAAVNAPF